jgi:hypothetical protein
LENFKANLFKLSDTELWSKIENKNGGVYILYSYKLDKLQEQKRFLEVDTEGILYIGKATKYSDRVISLVKSISPKYNGTSHICGRRYKSNPKISEAFPFETLRIELIETDEPEQLENTLLKKYFEKFGEAPPLNAHY